MRKFPKHHIERDDKFVLCGLSIFSIGEFNVYTNLITEDRIEYNKTIICKKVCETFKRKEEAGEGGIEDAIR